MLELAFNKNNKNNKDISIKEIRIYARDFSRFITKFMVVHQDGNELENYYIDGKIEVICNFYGTDKRAAEFFGLKTNLYRKTGRLLPKKGRSNISAFSKVEVSLIDLEENELKFRNTTIEAIIQLLYAYDNHIKKEDNNYHLDPKELVQNQKAKGIKIITTIDSSKRDDSDNLKVHLIAEGDNQDKTVTVKEEIYNNLPEGSVSNKDEIIVEEVIRTSNIVGVFKGIIEIDNPSNKKEIITSSCYIQIVSRFDEDLKNPYFLQSMLAKSVKAEDLNGFENLASSDNSLFHFMYVTVFCKQLKKAYENGIYRTYVRFERNDSRLKGVIDVSRHIRLNAGMDNGRVAYSYREMTADNSINHLILYAYDYAKSLYPDTVYSSDDEGICGKIISEIRTYAISHGSASVQKTIQQADKIISHPYYHEYEQLRQTCIRFLQYMGISMFDGDNEDDQVQGVLYYAPDLWESYLESGFKSNFLYFKPQFPVKVYGDEGIGITNNDIAEKEKAGSHETYPDYVFFEEEYKDEEDNKPFAILDAKYKYKWGYAVNQVNLIGDNQEVEEDTKEDIVPDDVEFKTIKFNLEDFTKCLRDMISLNVHKTGIINPQNMGIVLIGDDVRFYSKEKTIQKIDELYKKIGFRHLISEYNQEDEFYTIPVFVPKITYQKQNEEDKTLSFVEWNALMNYSYSKAMETIKEIVVKSSNQK